MAERVNHSQKVMGPTEQLVLRAGTLGQLTGDLDQLAMQSEFGREAYIMASAIRDMVFRLGQLVTQPVVTPAPEGR